MAVLQAARAKTLGLPLSAAYSWGLNRAIFYAAAKRRFGKGTAKIGEREKSSETPPRETYRLGEEEAFRDPNSSDLRFKIGNQVQTIADFKRSVTARFGTKEHFLEAWDEALKLMNGFDRSTLESQRRFYEEVYRYRRDQLSDLWTQKYSPRPKPKERIGHA